FIRFNTRTKAYKIFTPVDIDPASIPATSHKQIFTDSLKRVWINTNKAIAMYNSSSCSFTNFTLHLPSSDDNVYIQSIASDAVGNLWIGGGFEGLFYLDVTKGSATYYPPIGNMSEPVGNDKLFFDRAGTLWV